MSNLLEVIAKEVLKHEHTGWYVGERATNKVGIACKCGWDSKAVGKLSDPYASGRLFNNHVLAEVSKAVEAEQPSS